MVMGKIKQKMNNKVPCSDSNNLFLDQIIHSEKQ